MPWIEITEAHVKATLNASELAVLQRIRQTGKLPEIISQVTAEIRGYVRKQARPGAGETIPQSLLATACAIARYRFLNSIPDSTQQLLTEERAKENENALRLLRDVADGRFVLEEAETPSDERFKDPTPGPRIAPKRRHYSRRDAEGI